MDEHVFVLQVKVKIFFSSYLILISKKIVRKTFDRVTRKADATVAATQKLCYYIYIVKTQIEIATNSDVSDYFSIIFTSIYLSNPQITSEALNGPTGRSRLIS